MEAFDSSDLHPRNVLQFSSLHRFQLIQRIFGHFLEHALKRKLWDEELGQLLVLAEFSEGNSIRSVTVRLLGPRLSGTSSSLGGSHSLGGFHLLLTLESS